MTDLHALSGAYAVDALDQLEAARFERHLAECPDCAAEVRSLREAAAMLSYPVEVAPPADLRARVLAEARTVRPLPPPAAPVVEAVRRSARWFPRVVAAAVAVLVIGSGVTAWHPWAEEAPTPVAEQVMDAPDARTQSISFADGSRATLYHSRSVGRSVLVTKDMAPAPTGKVYELWYQDEAGTMVPAGLMDSGGDQTVVLHGSVGTSTGVGITVEPSVGSKRPTSPPVALFEFDKSV